MPSSLMCPEEAELLRIALEEPVEPAVLGHIDDCSQCRQRVEQLRAEVKSLAGHFQNGTTGDSTEDSPDRIEPRESSSDGATTSWKAKASAEAAVSETEPTGPADTAAAQDRAERQGTAPDAIGKYKVVGRIDGGGEADVYRVIHLKLGNDLVLKLGRRSCGTEDRAGLVAEGRLLVDLEHPNLVRIYDLDFHGDRPFLVMEYVHGRNLEDYARDEPVAPHRAALLVAKLAAVMGVAHRHGIIHCDIKPKNVLIDKLGEPRLIDFGMARLRHAWSDRVHPTWGGTLAYMAPEQARLEIDRIGPRSDIFALGGCSTSC